MCEAKKAGEAMAEGVHVRKLGRADVDLVVASDAFDHKVIPAEARAFLDGAAYEIVGAIHEDRIIGFASGVIHLHPDKAPQFFISEVGVNEEYCRQSIAMRLVKELVRIARSRGCKGVWLATEKDNAPARGLYRKLNARETKDIIVYDWDGDMDA